MCGTPGARIMRAPPAQYVELEVEIEIEVDID